MTPHSLRALFDALGFTAVVIGGGTLPRKEGNRRAREFAGLIEEFCRHAVPEAFEGREGDAPVIVTTGPGGKFAAAERMATAIVELYRKTGGCQPQDLLACGFTQDEIDRHWPMAFGFAKVALNIADA